MKLHVIRDSKGKINAYLDDQKLDYVQGFFLEAKVGADDMPILTVNFVVDEIEIEDELAESSKGIPVHLPITDWSFLTDMMTSGSLFIKSKGYNDTLLHINSKVLNQIEDDLIDFSS